MSDHDSNFFKNFGGVFIGLVVLAIIVFFVAQFVIEKSGIMNNYEAERLRDAMVAKRVEPVGKVHLMGEKAAEESGAAAPKSAKDIVSATCSACHGSGVLGAPKIGDHADWQARFDTDGGLEGLAANAIKGKGNMPPRGGAASLSDEEVSAAIAQMLSESGFDIEVPDLVAAAQAAAPAAEDAAPVVDAAKDAVDAATDAVSSAVSNTGDKVAEMADAAADTAASAADSVTQAASDMMAAASGAADLSAGKQTYDMACVACHSVGVAGAPKLGDVAAWSARIAQGMDTLQEHAIKGFRGMPPKGGRMDLSDDAVKNAVAYMADASK